MRIVLFLLVSAVTFGQLPRVDKADYTLTQKNFGTENIITVPGIIKVLPGKLKGDAFLTNYSSGKSIVICNCYGPNYNEPGKKIERLSTIELSYLQRIKISPDGTSFHVLTDGKAIAPPKPKPVEVKPVPKVSIASNNFKYFKPNSKAKITMLKDGTLKIEKPRGVKADYAGVRMPNYGKIYGLKIGKTYTPVVEHKKNYGGSKVYYEFKGSGYSYPKTSRSFQTTKLKPFKYKGDNDLLIFIALKDPTNGPASYEIKSLTFE